MVETRMLYGYHEVIYILRKVESVNEIKITST